MEDPMLIQIRNEKNWLQKALGILAYHTFQQAKYENVRGYKWKVSDTAYVTELSVGYISESLKLAKRSTKYDFSKMTREKALDYLRGLET
jgi:hypothetical protein